MYDARMDGWGLWHFEHRHSGYIKPELNFVSKADGMYERN